MVRKSRVLGRFALAAMAMAVSFAVRAADDDLGSSFLNPFPANDVYQLTIIGDGYAEGLAGGLVENLGGDNRLNIERAFRPLDGVLSAGFENEFKALDESFNGQSLDIAVVMLGESDRVSLKTSNGRRVAIRSPEWTAEYTRRIDRVMKALKQRGLAVYWVGLPTLARGEANEQAQSMNDIIRERAYLNGFKYVDAYQGFIGDEGSYSAYGPDLSGKIRLLRERDGAHFTWAGNLKLANFVERDLRRDMKAAKAERAVPLLGAEAEQAKVNPGVAVTAARTPSLEDKASTPQPDASTSGGVFPVGTAATEGGLEQKADNGRITLKLSADERDVASVELLRPAIPASIVALMARRDGATQSGDLLVEQIAGGLTLMNSITPAQNRGRSRLSPAQAPFFRLLVKGERLTPRPGRADDTAWPKGDSSTGLTRPANQPIPPG